PVRTELHGLSPVQTIPRHNIGRSRNIQIRSLEFHFKYVRLFEPLFRAPAEEHTASRSVDRKDVRSVPVAIRHDETLGMPLKAKGVRLLRVVLVADHAATAGRTIAEDRPAVFADDRRVSAMGTDVGGITDFIPMAETATADEFEEDQFRVGHPALIVRDPDDIAERGALQPALTETLGERFGQEVVPMIEEGHNIPGLGSEQFDIDRIDLAGPLVSWA